MRPLLYFLCDKIGHSLDWPDRLQHIQRLNVITTAGCWNSQLKITSQHWNPYTTNTISAAWLAPPHHLARESMPLCLFFFRALLCVLIGQKLNVKPVVIPTTYLILSFKVIKCKIPSDRGTRKSKMKSTEPGGRQSCMHFILVVCQFILVVCLCIVAFIPCAADAHDPSDKGVDTNSRVFWVFMLFCQILILY